MERYILQMHQVSSAKIAINVCCSLHAPTGGSNIVKYYTGKSFSISHLLRLMHNKYILNSFSVQITFCIIYSPLNYHHYFGDLFWRVQWFNLIFDLNKIVLLISSICPNLNLAYSMN